MCQSKSSESAMKCVQMGSYVIQNPDPTKQSIKDKLDAVNRTSGRVLKGL